MIRFGCCVQHAAVPFVPHTEADVLRSLATRNILDGLDLMDDYPEPGHTVSVRATELRTATGIEQFALKLARAVATRTQARCPVARTQIQ